METCNDVRNQLALNATTEDEAILSHLQGCVACSAYRRRGVVLDTVLRDELRWQAPAALTAQLLAIAAAPLVASAGMSVSLPPRPKHWYVVAVGWLTSAAVLVSLLVVWQFLLSATGQLGLDGALTQLLAAPAQGIQLLSDALPQSRPMIDFVLRVHSQLMWLLVVAVLWAILDHYTPSFRFERRQTA